MYSLGDYLINIG